MHEMLADLQRQAEVPAETPTRIALGGLDEADKATVADILGEGDVWAKVGTGNTYWRIVESVLAGVWRLRGSTADGQTSEWIEIGPVPQPILSAAAEQPRATIDIPRSAPQGAMNALAAAGRAAGALARLPARPGEPRHQLHTAADHRGRHAVADVGARPDPARDPLRRLRQLARVRDRPAHVWAVQYINSMGNVILDTLEIGGVPVSVLAAREDFEDSAERLGEILEAFTS